MLDFLKHKFFTIALFFLFIPFLGALYLLINKNNSEITFSEAELIGAEYHSALFDVMLVTQNYHSRSFLLQKTNDVDNELSLLEESIIKKINIIDDLEAIAIQFEVLDNWKASRKQILSSLNKKQGEPLRAYLNRQNLAIKSLNQLMKDISLLSNLLLDPDLEIYSMINVAMNIMPKVIQDLGFVQSKISGHFADTNQAVIDHRQILEIKGQFQDQTQLYEYWIPVIEREDKAHLATEINSRRQASQKLVEMVALFQKIANKEFDNMSHEKFLARTNNAIYVFTNTYKQFSSHLQWHIKAKIKSHKAYRFEMLFSLLFLLLVTIGIFAYARKNQARQQEVDKAERTNIILGTVVDGIITFNEKGVISSFNPSAEKIFGYKAGEILGKDVKKLMPELCSFNHEDDLKKAMFIEEAQLAGGEREMKSRRKDGSTFPMMFSINFFEQGGQRNFVASVRDVSEKKQLLANLSSQMEAINKVQAVVEFNVDGTIITANQNFLTSMGYKLEEIQGQHHAMFVEPHEREGEEYLSFWASLRRGEYQTAEYKRIGKNGRSVWIQGSYSPIFDDNGEPYKIVKFATDVTINKEVNANFSSQINAIKKSQGVVEFNLDGTIISANENFLKMVGYKLFELEGKHHRMLVTPEERESETYLSFWKNLYFGKYQSGEYKRLNKEGEEIWIQGSYNPIFDLNGKPYKVVKFATDVTIRKQVNANFSGQINAINKSQGVIEFDLEGKILTANQNFLGIVGYTLFEIKDKHYSIFDKNDEQENAADDDFWRTICSGEYQFGEYKKWRKDGKEVWISGNYNPIFDLNGKPFKVVVFVSDITARKDAEMKLSKYAKEMKIKNSELIIAREQAEAAARLKSDFLASVSHEIRTPMNGIMGMTELMLGTKLSNQQERYARTVMSSTNVLLNIIDDILDFSKIESRKMEVDSVPFNLFDVVFDTSELLAVRAREEALEVFVNYKDNTPKNLIGDPARIRQVLTNLVSNAIKFTESGYIAITIETVDNEELPKGKKCLKISVQDTGIGIEREAQEKIFDKFIQADASTARKFDGIGLGLAISKELASLMGGEIGLESTIGEGSNFWFTMLLDENMTEDEALSIPQNLKGLRLLIVDDIELSSTLIAQQLTPLGVECVVENHSSNAVEILQKAEQEGKPFDLVLIDYLMPHINGDALAQTIRTTKGIEDTWLVILAASGSEDYSRLFKDVGFNGYLNKPLKQALLFDVLSLIWKQSCENKKDIFVTPDDLVLKRLDELDNLDLQFKQPAILLAEDNRINQNFAVELLENAGCHVDVVTNGKQAVQRAEEKAYDLIFMDCVMPEMDGFEASSLIVEEFTKNNKKKAPIIALTGSAMKGDRERCLNAGMSDYLIKPIRKNQFMQILAKWLPDFIHDNSAEEQISFDGYKLLLIEDNRINAMMAEELLTKLGMEVTIATNGEKGVEARKNLECDIIFMDCMMPVMDGFEATMKIRKLEAEGLFKPCPIVALTANAMKGDRERCLEAGMDDYFTKPLKNDAMIEMLCKYLDPKGAILSEKDEAIENGFDTKLFENYQYMMDDKSEHCLKSFLDDSQIMMAQFNKACVEGDMQKISYIAHSLKSKSAAIGAMELSEILQNLEEEAKQKITNALGKEDLPAHTIDRFEKSFQRTQNYLTLYLEKNDAA